MVACVEKGGGPYTDTCLPFMLTCSGSLTVMPVLTSVGSTKLDIAAVTY